MATKKHKPKRAAQPAAPELLKLAEAQLQRGQTAPALQMLRRAEAELKPRAPAGAKKITMPPHLVAAQAALPELLARVHVAHAVSLRDAQQRVAALEEAVKHAPGNAHYLVARGAGYLLAGRAEAALNDFQKADEMQPGAPLITRAYALGLLATGRAQAASELLQQSPAQWRDESWRRLVALSVWPANNEAAAAPTDLSLSQSLLRGLRHLAAGATEQAQTELAALPALDHNPTRAEATLLATQFFYSGAANFAAQHYQAAFGAWREAQRLTQTHQLHLPWRHQLAPYLQQLAARVSSQDIALATACWHEALQLAPDDQVAAHNLILARRAAAQQHWHAGQIEQAAAIWQELLQAKPQDEAVLRNAAIASEKLGRKSEAVAHWRTLARLWRQQFKQRAAEAGFKERVQRLEQHLLRLMVETGEAPQELLNEIEAALKFDPDNHELRLQAAERLMEAGHPQKALKHLEQLERQQGASAALLVHKALAYEMAHRRKDARATLAKTIELFPDDKAARAAYLLLLGREAEAATEKDDLDRAIEICEEQLRLDPGYFPARGHLASLYFTLGRDAEAEQMLTQTLAAVQPTPQIYVTVGAVYLEYGKKKQAKEAFARAIELEPSAACFTEIGTAYLDNNDTKQALKHFDRAAETADVDALLTIAVGLAELGKDKDANRYIDKAKQQDPTHPMPHFIKALSGVGGPLGMLLATDKQREEMFKEFAEAERLMAGRPEFATLREELATVRRTLEQRPAGLGGGMLPPFLFGNAHDDDDDDDDDGGFFGPEPFFFDPPARTRKKRRK